MALSGETNHSVHQRQDAIGEGMGRMHNIMDKVPGPGNGQTLKDNHTNLYSHLIESPNNGSDMNYFPTADGGNFFGPQYAFSGFSSPLIGAETSSGQPVDRTYEHYNNKPAALLDNKMAPVTRQSEGWLPLGMLVDSGTMPHFEAQRPEDFASKPMYSQFRSSDELLEKQAAALSLESRPNTDLAAQPIGGHLHTSDNTNLTELRTNTLYTTTTTKPPEATHSLVAPIKPPVASIQPHMASSQLPMGSSQRYRDLDLCGSDLDLELDDDLYSDTNEEITESRQTENSEQKAARIASELLKEEEDTSVKAEKKRAKNKKKKEAKKRKKKENFASTAIDEEPPPIQKPTQTKKKKNSKPSAGSKNLEEPKSRGAIQDNTSYMDTIDNSPNLSEDESDINSAFFARATATMRSSGNARPQQSMNNEDDGDWKVVTGRDKTKSEKQKNMAASKHTSVSTVTVDESADNIAWSRDVAKEGNILATNGEFRKAIQKFSEAIQLFSGDQRYYGNRSFCHDLLGEYESALADAEKSVQLAPDWAKGYLRKGRALYGLKRYEEAEKAYQQVLSLEENSEDAVKELYKCHTLQLMSMGFTLEDSEMAAKECKVLAHAIDLLLSKRAETTSTVQAIKTAPRITSESPSDPPDMLEPSIKVENGYAVRSLWVGNVNSSRVTDNDLLELFGRYGKVLSVRILTDKHCAFVNFEHPQSAADAVNGLQGYFLFGGYLLIRYPENPKASMIHSSRSSTSDPEEAPRKTGPVNGTECYFWRTTGCHFGKKCHYKHIPAHKGIDKVTMPRFRSS